MTPGAQAAPHPTPTIQQNHNNTNHRVYNYTITNNQKNKS